MIDNNESAVPPAWREIQARSRALAFDMPSDAQVGSLLKLLIASKPGGRFLELGTGTGLATAWMLDGMDEHVAFRLVPENEDLDHNFNYGRVFLVDGDQIILRDLPALALYKRATS